MLAVGSDDRNTSAGGKVQIHEYNEASRFVQIFLAGKITELHHWILFISYTL